MTDSIDFDQVSLGCATDNDLKAWDHAEVLKAKTETAQVRARSSKPKVSGERTLTYIASDETPDRVGDVIKVAGWELMHYKQNPVILWGHDGTNIPPIGRSTNVRRGTGPGGKPALLSSIEFAPKEANPFAETVYQLAKGGFVNAVSVGFQPVENKDISEKERAALGMPKYGVLYTKANLLEISVVSVPANPSALVTGTKSLVHSGAVSDKDIEQFIKQVPLNAEDAYRRLKARLRSFVDMGAASVAEPSVEVEEKAEPDALKTGDMVSWNSSGGRAQGKIERVERDGEIEVPDSDFTVTGTAEDPAALIRVYRGDEPTDRRVGHKFSTLTKLKTMDSSETVTKPEEPEVPKMHSAVAEAIGHMKMAMTALSEMGEGGYDEQEEGRSLDSLDRRRSDADARLIEAQAEQARALSTLVDSISDLTRRIHGLGDVDGGSFEEPEAKASEAQVSVDISDESLRTATRAFLDRISQLTPKRS